MIRHRRLILSLVLLLSFAITVNVFAHCPLERESLSGEYAESPDSISCPDLETGPFIRAPNPVCEKESFTRMQKQAVYDGRTADINSATAGVSLSPPHFVLAGSSVPIYQLQAIYRI